MLPTLPSEVANSHVAMWLRVFGGLFLKVATPGYPDAIFIAVIFVIVIKRNAHLCKSSFSVVKNLVPYVETRQLCSNV